MKKKKLSKRTKLIILGTAISAGATFVHFIKDKDRSIKLRDKIIDNQDSYICNLEEFIMENITGYDFSYMVDIPQ